METKSRYEVIAELEAKKRNYIQTRDGFDDELKEHQKELKYLKRQIEDKEEEIANFKISAKEKVVTYNELIKSIDASLERFTKLQTK